MRMGLALVLSVFFTTAVVAQDADIETTITRQMEAFAADDFERAFSFASPGIRRLFGTPDRFGAMVRQGYPMVWRPGDVRFLELRDDGGRLWQKVQIVDQEGNVHFLEYQMIEGPDGWQIDGVRILAAPDLAV